MKCSKCRKSSVIYRKFEGRALCSQHFIAFIDKKIKKIIRQNRLVERNDHILVGFSGGKDSAILLYIIRDIAKARDDLKISAVFVDESTKGQGSFETAEKFCNELGVELHKISLSKEADSCTEIKSLREQLLIKKAVELEAGKIALGDNLDDEARDIISAYSEGDLFNASNLGAKTEISEGKKQIVLIKPLREIPGDETKLYVALKSFKVKRSERLHASPGAKQEIRDMVNAIEAKYPGTKFSIVKTFDRILPLLRKKSEKKSHIGNLPAKSL